MTSRPRRPSERHRVMVVFGTRPEAIKLAPVVLALRASTVLEPMVVTTAQHRTMLDQVIDVFGITLDGDLDIIRPGQSLTDITVRALARLSPWLAAETPDAVLVQGDTTTTFAAALGAFYHRIPVVHLEAGLRTLDPYSPFPEEMNRRLTTQLTTLHLPPTPRAKAQLLREGVPPERIVVTGNTVIDALEWAVGQELPADEPFVARVLSDPRRVLLVTAHRRESWGEGMTAIGGALSDIARAEPDLLVVFPVHPNPVVRGAVLPALDGLPNVVVVEPLPYIPFAHLMARADLILTDSGGIQEEAPSLGTPVVVMRDKTERPEALETGAVRLVGTDRTLIAATVRELLRDESTRAALARRGSPFGDGRASARTVDAVAHLLGTGERPEEFRPAQ